MPAPLLPHPAPDLPMVAALGDTVGALTGHGTAVLVAPPGTGKTTLVPLALADALHHDPSAGRIVVAEPRRLAARAAATRMAALTGTRLGEEIGFTVRGERRTSRATRVEVVTTGVLLQRLLRDPELPGVAAVVLDECHERHLDADLALAFCVDVRAVLRPDLHLLATSATADVPRISAALGGDGPPPPLVEVAAVTHPLGVVWAPPPRPLAWTPDGRVDRGFEAHVAAVTARAWDDGDPGDVLVFLPGLAEISRLAATLRSTRPDAAIAVLHGSLPAREQDAVLTGSAAGRRIVLSSAVAESSVTVPGVRTVVDAGLARLARADPARGLSRLVTTRVSRAVAEQRAGRAAREAPGRVYRCWSEADHQRLPAHPEPEIALADLAGAALALACWGAADGAGLALPDPPPSGPLAAARRLLTDLGALDEGGAVTDRGRRLARVGVHPRLARALVDGAQLTGAGAAEVVAVLADDGRPLTPDLVETVRALRAGTAPTEHERRWRQEVRRLRSALPEDAPAGAGSRQGDDVGLVAALAYPDRIGRRRADGSGYVLTGGSVALPPQAGAGTTTWAHQEWLVVADGDVQVDRDGSPRVRVRLAAPLTLETALRAGDGLLREGRQVHWADGDVVAREVRRLGAVLLEDRPARGVTAAELNAAAREGLRRDGLDVLTWGAAAVRLRQRLALCHHWLPDVWPDVGDEALLADPTWLDPGLTRARSAADLRRLDVAGGLRSLLPWSAPGAGPGSLDELAPERIAVPSGSSITVDYADPERPVLAVKLQECFGWRQGPRVAGGLAPVVLHLLSPAGRPAAVTADLESFWTSGYPQVRAELRGRYPKHPWPQDPSTVAATRLTSAALRSRADGPGGLRSAERRTR